MNGMSVPLELEGLDSAYDAASAGCFIKAFAKHGTSEIVCILDEIDKLPHKLAYILIDLFRCEVIRQVFGK